MAKLGSINIMLGLNTARLTAGFNQAKTATAKFVKDADRSFQKLQKSLFSVKTAIGGVVAALGVGKFLETAGAFESMSASLITVTGSVEKANMAMGGIREFAKKTPFQVRELTDAFIKLKSLGLTPSEQSLTSYGNTASAMGKSLNQMIEAVADATTGEFERLKEFGIKARSQGDQVSFTFQGVTTTIGKNAREIEDYLQRIGNVQFAGAMEKQMGTINGKLSNLSDAFDNFIVTFAQLGAGSGSKGVLDSLIDGVNWFTDAIKMLPGLFVSLFASFDKMVTNIEYKAKAVSVSIKDLFSLTKSEEHEKHLEAINEARQREIDLIDQSAIAYIEAEQKRQEASMGGSLDGNGPDPAAERMAKKQAELDAEFEMLSAHTDQVIAEFKREADERKKIEKEVSTTIVSMKEGVMASAISLLQTLGQKNKAFAIAAIALEKGLAIARAIQNTAVAVTKAIAVNPYDLATVARIKTMGAIQVGLIAATGLAQAANVGGGGASPGTAGGPPIETAPSSYTQSVSRTQAVTQEVRIVIESSNTAQREAAEQLLSTLDDMGLAIVPKG